eukprot:s910_g3.t1
MVLLRRLPPQSLDLVPSAARCPLPLVEVVSGGPFRRPPVLMLVPRPWPLHGASPPSSDVPDISRERSREVLELASRRSSQGLLFLKDSYDDQVTVEDSVRVFNCYKWPECDRMIGDRRSRNFRERALQGPSVALPCGPILLGMFIDPKSTTARIAITDRKDFYHQLGVGPQKACHNAVYPPLPEAAFLAALLMMISSAGAESTPAEASESVAALRRATSIYDEHGLLGSLVWSLLLGGWVSSFLYRWPLMAIFSEAFRLVPGGLLDPSNPRVIPQPRPVADELALAAALSPLAVADLAVPWDSHLYATDSSEEGAAIVSAPVSPELSALLWRSSDRKDGATKLLSRAQAVLRKIDPLFEEAASVDASPDLGDHERDFVGMPCRAGRPLGLRYHFLQVGSTATALCDALAARGWVVGPILHPAFSPVYDLSSQTFFLWLYRMLDAGKVLLLLWILRELLLRSGKATTFQFRLRRLNFKTAAEELVFGQVYIALHLTRGIDHANVRTKDSFYIVGNRNHILSLNAVWLEKEQLTTLCKDVKRLGAKLHLFEAEPYALCKKDAQLDSEKYIPLCMFAITCLLTIGATASSILNWEDGKACLMIAAGLVFSLTVMCCFCLNFRRRKILDWEVPLTELDHFAREWSSKHGLKLRFEFNRVGPSYFVVVFFASLYVPSCFIALQA